MLNAAMPYAKKFFSLALLFNALLTLEYAVQIIIGYYTAYPLWKPFPPAVVDGSIFWVIVLVAVVNLFPAASTGQTRCSRLWFHHYVYGLAIAITAAFYLLLFTPFSVFELMSKNITDVNVNVGRFFVLGGLTLVIDDLPDISGVIKRFVNYLKLKAYQGRKALHAFQLVLGFVSLYFCIGVVVHILVYPYDLTLANSILVGTLLVTSLTAFASVKRKVWLNVEPREPTNAPKPRC